MTLVFQRNHGQCLTALERYKEAEALLVPAYEGLAASLGPQHEQTGKALAYVIDLYEAWGKTEAVDAWRAKLHAPSAP